jgi:5'-methylthioadenosine phosphorylase
MKVAFVSGTSIANSDLFADWKVERVPTFYGEVVCRTKGDFALLNRHGPAGALPPHAINHRANLRALSDLGFKDVVALNSVGSLKKELTPGMLVSCSDYVGLIMGPATYYDQELKGGAPAIANNLLPLLLGKLTPEFRIHTDRVYVQTRGPRFETKAEIRIIQHWGDVVGMTAGHEADLCTELGLNYNSLAIVDNYANGLEGVSIDFTKFRELVKENQALVNRLFRRMLEVLA